MNQKLPWGKGLANLSQTFRERRQSVQAVAAFCLEKISSTDGHLRAWSELQPDRVLVEAKELDRLIDSGIFLGPMHGIPIGIKDIIDVRGYSTGAGYGPWKHAMARQDAEVVARLRSNGALILGKTATCAFASFDPAPTRHPAFVGKSPGGSSAGSAVAVAAEQCPLALGTQTGGSILRPAAYCGVAGFKPTHGWVPTQGVVPLAPTLDHVGLISQTVAALSPAFQAMAEPGAISPQPPPITGSSFLLVWTDIEEVLGSAMTGWKLAVESLAVQGVPVRSQPTPKSLIHWLDSHRKIMGREAFVWHNIQEPRWKLRYPPKIQSLLAFGENLSGREMAEAYQARQEARQFLSRELASHGILCLPTIHAGIPDRESTGDYRFQGLASLVGFPAVGLPWAAEKADSAHLYGESLQLVGNLNSDSQLLAFAERFAL